MLIHRLRLENFRNYESLDLTLGEGLTALLGPNGAGKTNVLEAIGLLATLKSFRGAPTANLIRKGAPSAIIRANGVRDDRPVLIELQLANGRIRGQVNRQRLRRTRDLLGALRITVFAPDDLALIKEGPAVRRDYVDDLLVALDPRVDAIRSDIERVLKQRNALLRSAGGRLDDTAADTLDVWDAKLAAAGSHLTVRRENLLAELMPGVASSYGELAGRDEPSDVVATSVRSWDGDDLARALAEARPSDVRRGVTTIGPHRDDVAFTIDGFESRTEASQGEQRTLALALRLAGHRLVTDRLGEAPLLLLDDVLSELDPGRAEALLDRLPPGQTVVTSASGLPAGTMPDHVLHADAGSLVE